MTKLDEELIELLKSRDVAKQDVAFKHLYEHSFKAIENMVENNLGSGIDASDVFQETMVAVYHNFNKPGYDINCGLKTYVYAIAKNVWLKKQRKKRPEFQLKEDHNSVLLDESHLQVLEEKEKYDRFHQLLDSLEEECKSILVQFYFDGKSIKEITHMLKIKSESVTKNKKSRCLKKLKELAGDFLNIFGTNS
jgi:RNA polymerase sigma factor (sigma-70 family)